MRGTSSRNEARKRMQRPLNVAWPKQETVVVFDAANVLKLSLPLFLSFSPSLCLSVGRGVREDPRPHSLGVLRTELVLRERLVEQLPRPSPQLLPPFPDLLFGQRR